MKGQSVYICKFCSCIDTIIILQHVGSSELGSIVLNALDLGNYDLKDFNLLLPPGLTLSTIGHFAKAIVGADGKVINLCDHVVYTVEKRYSVSCNTCLQLFIKISHFQLETGTFCGSFQAEIGTFCVHGAHCGCPTETCFQQLRLTSAFEDKCNSSYSCSMSEACSSVAHQCDSRCGWLEKDQPTQVERELISVNTTVFEHNWNNNKYCFNVYCMSIAL